MSNQFNGISNYCNATLNSDYTGIYDNYIHQVDTSQAISLALQINQGEEHSG